MSCLSKDELKFWVAFNQFATFGPKRLTRLISYFPDLKTAWSSSVSELISAGIEQKIAEQFIIERSGIDPENELAKVEKNNLKIITIKDDSYPHRLKEISNPPALLYLRGHKFSIQDEYAVAVVGTRKITDYGRLVTEDLIAELTRHGLVIVSGLALGIDATAHKSCINAQGRTIAVLGNGLDSIYPASHLPLARRITDNNGLIISEFALGTPSYRSNFPYRNRIISGLTLGTLVIEADEKSGSLITAQIALEQNRDVFTVPGSIYSKNSRGPHQLIKNGAIPVTCAQDIIQALQLEQIPQTLASRKLMPTTPEEGQIIDNLTASPKTADQLIKYTGLDAAKINSILVSMELKGLVRNTGSNVYSLAR